MTANVLLVDDDEGVLHALERVLRRGGYRVSAYLDAETALRRSHPVSPTSTGQKTTRSSWTTKRSELPAVTVPELAFIGEFRLQ